MILIILFESKKYLISLKVKNYGVILSLISLTLVRVKQKGVSTILRCLRNERVKIIKLLHGSIIHVLYQLNFNLVILRLLKKSGIYLLNVTVLIVSFIDFSFMVILVACIKNQVNLLINFSQRCLLYEIICHYLNQNDMTLVILSTP